MDQRRLAALAAIATLAAPVAAHADAFVRVLVQRAKVRTGPGAGFRTMFVAERGQILGVRGRGTRGFWYKVELPDGTTGWVHGEQVIPFEVVEDEDVGVFGRAWRATKSALLGPSPVPYADVELSFSAGALGGEGLFLFRPAWILDSTFALEAFVGESPRAQETLLLGGLGWTLRLAPGGPVGPYVHAGVGAAHFSPKEDAFTLRSRTLMVFGAGGGLEITVKKRITLRADFRNWTFFDENEAANAQEYSGGLAIFF